MKKAVVVIYCAVLLLALALCAHAAFKTDSAPDMTFSDRVMEAEQINTGPPPRGRPGAYLENLRIF